jgi:Carbamoylphosphate synthase small subunit
VIVHRNRSDEVIVVVDCGIKHGILQSLYHKLGYTIVRVPCKTSADKVMEHEPVGVVFSNGPGNPNLLKEPVETYKALVEYGVPILGICLGHQVGTIALGGRIRKMKFGHRAVNKPVVDVTNNSCYISTHNHGYAILDKADMPHGAKLWFVNPDDGTIEGWYHERYKILSVQFHPEARPGPWDTTWVFDRFGKLISP